jgi:hypothetical protein
MAIKFDEKARAFMVSNFPECQHRAELQRDVEIEYNWYTLVVVMGTKWRDDALVNGTEWALAEIMKRGYKDLVTIELRCNSSYLINSVVEISRGLFSAEKYVYMRGIFFSTLRPIVSLFGIHYSTESRVRISDEAVVMMLTQRSLDVGNCADPIFKAIEFFTRRLQEAADLDHSDKQAVYKYAFGGPVSEDAPFYQETFDREWFPRLQYVLGKSGTLLDFMFPPYSGEI